MELYADTGKLSQKYNESMKEAGTLMAYNSFQDIHPGITVREGYSRSDYDWFRVDEQIPTSPKEVMTACNQAYENVAIVTNVINLMCEFSVKGLSVSHKNKKRQKILRAWWERSQIIERAERFVSSLLRFGIVFVKPIKMQITNSQIEKISKLEAMVLEKPKAKEIPIGFVFYNPELIDTNASSVQGVSGNHQYVISLPRKARRSLKKATPQELMSQGFSESMSVELSNGAKQVPIDSDVSVYYYKRDDWSPWGKPILKPLLNDLLLYTKAQLADLTALDSSLSSIVVWKLGNLDKQIIPGGASFRKLRDLITAAQGNGGRLDVVWGPDLDVKIIETNLHKFLGPQKYEPILNSIYTGLGIPSAIIGTSSSSGTSNNYVSLKTLIERLNYTREILKNWLYKELNNVQLALGYKLEAKIHFDETILANEDSMRRLLFEMWDRDLMSDETVQERMNEHSDIETARVKREYRSKNTHNLFNKVGPYRRDNKEELTKIALNKGLVTPEDVGVESSLNPQEVEDLQTKEVRKSKTLGNPNKGRPSGSKDKIKRRRIKSKAFLIASRNWNLINSELNKVYLSYVNRSNLRQLTSKEFDELEDIKFKLLANADKILTKEDISEMLERDDLALPKQVKDNYTFFCDNSTNLTTTDKRFIYILSCIGEVDG